MPCPWGRTHCRFEGSAKCDTCFLPSQYFKERRDKAHKGLRRKAEKKDKRKGAHFEYQNHVKNKTLLTEDIRSTMTLNSGATILEKGDEQIRGLVNIMEELKTKVTEKARGKRTFTIHESWLSKLRQDAKNENMDFHYLKFSFHEGDNRVYVIIEEEELLSLVKTLVTDRRRAKRLLLEKEVLEKRLLSLESDVSSLHAKLALEKAKHTLNAFMKEDSREDDA